MLPNISLKSAGIGAALLTGITGTSVGIAYGVGSFKTPSKPQTQKLNQLLEQQNKYSFLSTRGRADAQAWNAAWAEYKKDNSNNQDGKDKWNIEGWKENGLNQVPQEFKDACANRRVGEVIDINDSQYTDFVKYCTRPKTVQEALGKFGFKAIGQHRGEVWTVRFQKYKTSENQLPNAKIVNSDRTFEFLKQGCTAALGKKTIDDNYEETFEAAKEWCGGG